MGEGLARGGTGKWCATKCNCKVETSSFIIAVSYCSTVFNALSGYVIRRTILVRLHLHSTHFFAQTSLFRLLCSYHFHFVCFMYLPYLPAAILLLFWKKKYFKNFFVHLNSLLLLFHAHRFRFKNIKFKLRFSFLTQY